MSDELKLLMSESVVAGLADDPHPGYAQSLARDWLTMHAALAAAREAHRWVRVVDRVPDDSKRVLVCAKSSAAFAPFVDVAMWSQRECWVNDNWHRDLDRSEIDWWMPLPAPPASPPKASPENA